MVGNWGWDARGGCWSEGNAADCLSREAGEGDISLAVSSCASDSCRARRRYESWSGEVEVAGEGADTLLSLLWTFWVAVA